MGKQFGNLIRLKGVTYYTLSPNELKPFSGMFNPGIQNTIRRFRENFLFISVPLGLSYALYDWAMKTHHKLNCKNPEEFKNDV